MLPEPRIRWRCRRGMLENDILLEAFLRHGYASLDQEGRDAFERLLAYPDDVLWRIVAGQQETTDAGIASIVPLLRSAIADMDPP